MEENKNQFSEEQLAKSVNETIEKRTAGLKEDISSKASAEEVKELRTKLDETTSKLEQAEKRSIEQGEELTKLKEVEVRVTQKYGEVERTLIENKEAINSARRDRKPIDLEFRAGTTFDSPDIGDRDRSSVTTMPSIGQIAVRRPFMQDIVNNQNLGTEFVQQWEQDTIVRDAQNTIRCSPITSTTDLTWARQQYEVVKIKDTTDICIDMLDDHAFVDGEVRNLLNSSIQLKKDNDILYGTGAGNQILGIDGYAATFNAATAGADYSASIQAPTLYDLIDVVAGQIAAAGQENKFVANYALLNAKDARLMRLGKDGENNYLNPLFVSTGFDMIGGVAIIENPNINEGEMYVGDFSKATLFNRKQSGIELAFENRDNFDNELVTLKVYERLAFVVRNTDADAFIHVPNIATAITDITKP